MTTTATGGLLATAGTGHPVVELQGITRTFPGEPPTEVLRGIDLQVMPGDYLSIVGPSGSGKSTLLNLLGLLDRPTDGHYILDGFDTAELTDKQRTGLRGQRIGFVFQAFHLLSHRSVTENVMISQLYRRVSRSKRRKDAVAALERVGLGHRLNAVPTTLSGGERQRVAIARAIVTRPSLLLADEPTGNLDTATSESILELFDELHRAGHTLLVITHDTEVSLRAERSVRMLDGLLTEQVRGA